MRVDQTITPPSSEDVERLARQVLRVRALATTHVDRELPNDERALDVLQALLDSGAIRSTDTADLQAIGIVFGMQVVDAVEGIDWAMVEDEYGRDPALRYESTSLLVFPMTMISKRVEDGLTVDVRGMFTGLCEKLDDLKEKVPKPH